MTTLSSHPVTPCGDRPLDISIPLWTVGRRRPDDRERRKNAGALDRHVEDRTGTAPVGCLQRRSADLPTPPTSMVSLWQDEPVTKQL